MTESDAELDKRLDEAVLLLRTNGFIVKTDTARKRGLLYLIRKPILYGRYQYLLRTRRTSNRESSFDEKTEIAPVDLGALKWEPIEGDGGES